MGYLACINQRTDGYCFSVITCQPSQFTSIGPHRCAKYKLPTNMRIQCVLIKINVCYYGPVQVRPFKVPIIAHHYSSPVCYFFVATSFMFMSGFLIARLFNSIIKFNRATDCAHISGAKSNNTKKKKKKKRLAATATRKLKQKFLLVEWINECRVIIQQCIQCRTKRKGLHRPSDWNGTAMHSKLVIVHQQTKDKIETKNQFIFFFHEIGCQTTV